ncbi:MAG: hypothetical protein AAGC79_03930 [Pseudomonadota bacterium]
MKWLSLAVGIIAITYVVATETSVFAPQDTYVPLISGSKHVEPKINPDTREKFLDFLAGRFDDLPKKVDDRITLSEVTMEEQTVSFHFRMKDPNSAASVVALNGMKPAIIEKVCKDPRFLALAEENAWAEFEIDDLFGFLVERFSIDPAKC